MSRKSMIAYSRWPSVVVAIGLALLVSGAFNLYTWQTGKGSGHAEAPQGEATPDRVTRDLATGALTAFVVHDEPRPVPDFAFQDAEGEPLSIADWRGRVVLVNLWATWCGPCREEMPSLAELQTQLGSDDFEVVAISVDRQGAEVARPFLDKVGADSLALYLDPSTEVVNELKAVGLPATILIGRSGRELGRMLGPAEWHGPEAVRLIEAAIAETGES